MHLLTDALDRVEEELLMESGDSDSRVYNANESITEAKLHEELMASDGTYFFIHDEIEGECMPIESFWTALDYPS